MLNVKVKRETVTKRPWSTRDYVLRNSASRRILWISHDESEAAILDMRGVKTIYKFI